MTISYGATRSQSYQSARVEWSIEMEIEPGDNFSEVVKKRQDWLVRQVNGAADEALAALLSPREGEHGN